MFGLSFLNPLVLLGALASLVPLLIHFLTKKEPPVLVFPTIRFLKEAAEKVRRRWQIRHILLLILRMLIIFLLALLFARPTLSQTSLSANHNIAVIIDNSPSMAYQVATQSRLLLAKKRAKELLKEVSPNSRVLITVLVKENESKLAFEEVSEGLLKRIEEINLKYERGSFFEVLSLVSKQAVKQGIELEQIYFLTDRQKNIFQETDFPLQKLNAPVIVLLGGEESYHNAAVLNCQSSSLFHYVGYLENFSLDFGYWSSPVNTQENVLAVNIDEKKILQTQLELKPDKISRYFNYTFATPGTHQITIELEEDGLLEDNKYYQTIEVQPRPKVLLVSEKKDNSEGSAYYLKKALNISFSAQQPLVNLLETTPERLGTHQLSNFQLIIYPDFLQITRSERILLEDFVSSGGSLFLIPSPKVEPTILNNELFGPTRRYQGFLPALLKQREKPKTLLSLRVENWQHPLFSNLAEAKEGILADTRFYEYLSFASDFSSGVSVLIRYDNQEAALLEKKFGQGRVIFSSSSWDNKWTNLVTTPAFLPLVFQLTYYLSQPPPISPEVSKVRENFPVDESDLTMITLAELQQRFPQISWDFTAKKILKNISTTSKREIHLPLLFTVLVLLVLEAFLTHRRKDKYGPKDLNF